MELVLEELANCIPAAGSVGDRLAGKELERAIRAFLDTIPQRDQNIFLRRYFYVETCGAIAERYGMRPDTVQKVLTRTRRKLKKHLTEEGYAV